MKLVERTTSNVPPQQFRSAEHSESFWSLVDAGVASLVRSRAAPFGIRVGPLVGEAILEDGTHLTIEEKVPGTLLALLRWSLPDDIRVAEAPSGAGAESPVLAAYASHFLAHLAEYLRYGQLKEYRARDEESPRPRGALDLRSTARMRSRGIRGLVAVRRPELTADNLPNQLLSLASRAIEPLAQSAGWDRRIPVRARSLSVALATSDTYDVERSTIDRRYLLFDEALRDPRVSGDLYGALAFARALVLHLGAWSGSLTGTVPRSFFLSLETLFEEAVRQVLCKLYPEHQVSKGAALKEPLFADLPERYVADPDIVMSDGGIVRLVADVKYKDIELAPAHSDVYQLVAHCSAFGCNKGMLIYPGDAPTIGPLGETRSSVRIFWGRARPNALEEDMKYVFEKLSAW